MKFIAILNFFIILTNCTLVFGAFKYRSEYHRIQAEQTALNLPPPPLDQSLFKHSEDGVNRLLSSISTAPRMTVQNISQTVKVLEPKASGGNLLLLTNSLDIQTDYLYLLKIMKFLASNELIQSVTKLSVDASNSPLKITLEFTTLAYD